MFFFFASCKCFVDFPFLHSDGIFLLISSSSFISRANLSLGRLPAHRHLRSPRSASQSFLPLALSATAPVRPQPEQLPSPLSLSTCPPLQLISWPVPSAMLTFARFPKSFPDSGPVHLTLQTLGLANRCNQVSQLLVIDLYIYECLYQDM